MIKVINRVKGFITLEIEGLNIERFLNKIIRHKIHIVSCKRISLTLSEITIFDTDKTKLFSLLKNDYNVSVGSISNGNKIYKFLFKRYGFIIGLIFSIVCFTFLCGKVWKIDIEGNELIKSNEIITILNNAGVKNGSRLEEIDTDYLEGLLLEKNDKISLVSVIKIGSTIKVNIKEKVDDGTDKITSIISDFDGIINNIELIQGTCLVKCGDIVKKGDILVDSYTFDGDNNKIQVQAKAKIYATIWVKGEIVFDENETRLVRSGRYFTKSNLNMFGLNMPLKRDEEKYNYYEIEKFSKNICKNTLIPFTIIKEKIYELVEIEDNKSFEDEKELLIKKSIYLAYDKLNAVDNLDIISEQTDIIQVGSKYYVTTYVKLIKQIGVDK